MKGRLVMAQGRASRQLVRNVEPRQLFLRKLPCFDSAMKLRDESRY